MAKIGDILAKLGRGEALTTNEQQQIRLWGNQSEFDHSYVAGLQNGRSDISASEVLANKLSVGKELFYGSAARYYNDLLTVAHQTYTDIPSWTADYASAGFYANGKYVYIPQTGIYQVIIHSWWNASATGFRDMGTKINDAPNSPFDNKSSNSFLTYLNAIDEKEYRAGDAISLTVYQNSGGDLVMGSAWMVFRRIR